MPTTGEASRLGLRASGDVRRAIAQAIAQVGPGLYGIACSGGADSVALAHAVIAEVGGANVVVVTIDHGLVEGSGERAQQVAAWARGQGAEAVVRRVQVERRASVEAAARTARYAALDAIADELGLAWVMLAHTERDQAETVLMRVVRGTGPAGLAGIPSRRGIFMRPLLALPRTAIDAYVAEHDLPVWDDPMNADQALTRVRFRERILPALRRENPALDDALVRLAASAREWADVIDELARPFARFPIYAAALAKQRPAIRKRALALALEAEGIDFDAAHLDALDDLVLGPDRGEISIDLPGVAITRSYGRIDRARARARARDTSTCTTPGYELRSWTPGDRMRPARLKGRSRKLSDLYIDAKIPRTARRTARVLVRRADATIVWAEFIGLAHGESPELIPA